jgi:hypothetical protein
VRFDLPSAAPSVEPAAQGQAAESSAPAAAAEPEVQAQAADGSAPGLAAPEAGQAPGETAQAAASTAPEPPRMSASDMETDEPPRLASPAEARKFWNTQGPEAEARAKKARVMTLAVSGKQHYDTVDEDEPVIDMEAALAGEPEQTELEKNQWTEIGNLEEFESFEVVPIDEADLVEGKFLTTRWVDTEEKSRFVSREFKDGDLTDDHFAPGTTSPTHRLVDFMAAKRGHAKLIADFSRAFLHVVEDELIYVKPPEIWLADRRAKGLSDQVWWRMKKVLYGRRKAAQYWTELLASIMTEFSLERSLSAPHLFRTPDAPKDMIFMSSHMDDIHGEGPRKRLEALVAFLQTKLQIKFSHVIGDSEQHEKYEFLRRERVVCNGKCWVRPRQTHFKRMAELMGVERCKCPDTPVAAGDRGDLEIPDDPALDAEQHSTYRTVVGILLHIVVDRGDLGYGIRLVSRKIGQPTDGDWTRLKRLVKFAFGTREDWQLIEPTKESGNIMTHVDSDWAGDKITRKSCSCAVIRLDGVVLAMFVRGQKIEALSSAEAEFYAAVMGIAEALHIQQLLAWLGDPRRLEVFSDSSAARSILARMGVGKVRHLQVKLLWVQRLVNSGQVLVSKVLGSDNVADIGTKPLSASVFNKHREALGFGASPEDSVIAGITAGGGMHRARQVTAAAAAGVSARIMTLAIALAGCLERTEGQEVALVAAAPTLAVTVKPEGGVTWITEERWMSIVIFLWIMSLMCTAWCTWKVSGIWRTWTTPKPQESTADKSVQSQTTYRWWLTTPRFVPLPEQSHGSWNEQSPTIGRWWVTDRDWNERARQRLATERKPEREPGCGEFRA